MFVGEGRDCYVGVGAKEVFVEVEEVCEAAADDGCGAGEGFEVGLGVCVSCGCFVGGGYAGRVLKWIRHTCVVTA